MSAVRVGSVSSLSSFEKIEMEDEAAPPAPNMQHGAAAALLPTTPHTPSTVAVAIDPGAAPDGNDRMEVIVTNHEQHASELMDILRKHANLADFPTRNTVSRLCHKLAAAKIKTTVYTELVSRTIDSNRYTDRNVLVDWLDEHLQAGIQIANLGIETLLTVCNSKHARIQGNGVKEIHQPFVAHVHGFCPSAVPHTDTVPLV